MNICFNLLLQPNCHLTSLEVTHMNMKNEVFCGLRDGTNGGNNYFQSATLLSTNIFPSNVLQTFS